MKVKEVTPDLGKNYLFTAQDDPSCKNDHFKLTIEVIFRYMLTRVDYLQDLTSLFKNCKYLHAELPVEPLYPMTFM